MRTRKRKRRRRGKFQVVRSNRGLQAVEGAPGLGEAELAVHGVVVPVEGRGAPQAAPTSLLESVRLGLVLGAVKEWCPRLVLLQDELWVSHEVMDGASGFGFLEAFVEGATERIHHFDLGGVGRKKTKSQWCCQRAGLEGESEINDERQPSNKNNNKKENNGTTTATKSPLNRQLGQK